MKSHTLNKCIVFGCLCNSNSNRYNNSRTSSSSSSASTRIDDHKYSNELKLTFITYIFDLKKLANCFLFFFIFLRSVFRRNAIGTFLFVFVVVFLGSVHLNVRPTLFAMVANDDLDFLFSVVAQLLLIAPSL